MLVRLLALAACVALCVGCVAERRGRDPLLAGQALPVQETGFIRTRSALPAPTVNAVATEFAAAVEQAAPALALPLPATMADLVVLRAGEGGAWGLRGIDGLSLPGPRGRVILAVSSPLGERDRAVVRHEAIHWLLGRTYVVSATGDDRLSGLPRWLDEGLATAFETSEGNRERRAQFARLARPRWRARLGLEHTLGLRRDERATSADYARAWAVCTDLLRTDPETLRALLQARLAWCAERPAGAPFQEHERDLVAATRAEFARIVLRGAPLGEWLDRVTAEVLSQPAAGAPLLGAEP